MTRTLPLVSLLLLATAACRDSTGSGGRGDLTVQLTATASAPYHSFAEDGGPLVSCDVTFQAVSSGDEGALGDWTGGVIRYRVGASTEVVDSLVMSDDELLQSFGAQFGYRSARDMDLQVTAVVPFSVELQLRYRVVGEEEEHSVTAGASCAVPQGAPTGPAPSITALTVSTPPDGLEPGDTVHVTWTATASPALWATGIEVSGALATVRRVRGEGQGSMTQTVSLVVPFNAPLGEPVRVRAFAIDPWARSAATAPWSTAPLADHTAPVVESVRTVPVSGEYTTSLVGQYGTRDTLVLFAAIRENHQMATAEYEFGPQGVRGSAAVQFGPGGYQVRIPLNPGLEGATDFRVRFADASGNQSPEIAAAHGAVRVYPVRDAVVRSATLPEQPHDVVVDPARGRVYVGLNRTELRVYSLPDLALVRTVPLPFPATSLELTADGDSLLIAHRLLPQLAVMDVNATTAPAAMPLDGVGQVYGIRIASTGRAIALVRLTAGGTAVLEVDLATGARRTVATASVPNPLEGMGRSADRRKLMLGAGCVFDAVTESLGPCRSVRNALFELPVQGDATGAYWARNLEVFDAGLNRVLQIPDPAQVLWATTIPQAGGGALVFNGRGLMRVRPDGLVAERLDSPVLGWMRLSDDGTLLAAWGGAGGGYFVRVLDPR